MHATHRLLAATALAATLGLPAAAQAPIPLRITGHFTANAKVVEGIERPFYGTLPGRVGAPVAITFNPIDQVGAQPADVLRLLRSGAFDVMTTPIGQVARDEPFLDGIDLIGVSTTVADLRKATEAMREAFDTRIQERFGVKAVALWPFGPQFFFCNHPVKSIADFRGLKIRSYTPSMSALIQHFGGTPVTLNFTETYPALQRGVVNCGITSATSAHQGNWAEVTTHIFPMSLAGGMQGHFMSVTAWRRFSPAQQQALDAAFKDMENQLWALADSSNDIAIACMTNQPSCTEGKKFTNVLSPVPAADDAALRAAVSTAVLPSFRESCSRVWNNCVTTWNRTVGAARGYSLN